MNRLKEIYLEHKKLAEEAEAIFMEKLTAQKRAKMLKKAVANDTSKLLSCRSPLEAQCKFKKVSKDTNLKIQVKIYNYNCKF
jgi:hypothetical protein